MIMRSNLHFAHSARRRALKSEIAWFPTSVTMVGTITPNALCDDGNRRTGFVEPEDEV